MKIIFQGDSITDCGRHVEQHGNWGLGDGYVNLVASELLATEVEKSLKIINKGISGNRVVDLYARWKSDILNEKPDVLSILIGINDTWHKFLSNNGIEPAHYKEIYTKLLTWTLAEFPNVKLILGVPFAFTCGVVTKEWIEELKVRQEMVRELAKEFNASYIEFQEIFDAALKRAPMEYWLGDGVHPTLAGHHLMKNEMVKVIQKLI